jgi:AcrR family transcriptional regulator
MQPRRREQIIALRNEGLSIRQIMVRLGMSSPSLVHYYAKRSDSLNGVPKQKLIACIRQIELRSPEDAKAVIQSILDEFLTPKADG